MVSIFFFARIVVGGDGRGSAIEKFLPRYTHTDTHHQYTSVHLNRIYSSLVAEGREEWKGKTFFFFSFLDELKRRKIRQHETKRMREKGDKKQEETGRWWERGKGTRLAKECGWRVTERLRVCMCVRG